MNKIKIIFTASVLMICAVNCLNRKTGDIFSYSDGSGNLYLVTENSLEYIPVQPAESSSGTYSGGSHVKYELQKDEYNLLKVYFQNAVKNKKDRMADRVKSSGMIIVNKNGRESSYILAPLSEDKIRLEILLFEMRSR